MVDSVLVTVQMKKPSFSVDMELPANLQIKALKKQLLEELKAIRPETFGRIGAVELWHQNKILDEQSSLTNSRVWDGSFLTVTAEVWNGNY